MPQPINLALIRIVRRAEQSENDILVNTFVDTGMLGEVLSSPDHQIVYGRRGTGKTHALTYLSNKIRKAGNLALYIDLRTIGSNGSIYSDESLPVSERVSRLLVDVGNEVHYKIQEVILEDDLLESDQNFTKSVQYLDQLASALTTIRVEGETETSDENESSHSQASISSLKTALQAVPSLNLEASDANSNSSKFASKVSRRGKATLEHFA